MFLFTNERASAILTKYSQHQFSQLPPELRLRIWQYSLPRGRVVPIRFESRSEDEIRFSSRQLPSGCLSSAQIPPNLHVCHEARSEAVRHYDLSFGVCGGEGQVFFNPLDDILYFGSRDGYMATESQFRLFVQMVPEEDLALVRRLAINDSIFWPQPEYISSIASGLTVELLELILTKLPSLEELIFIPKDENPVYSGETTLVEPAVPDLRLLHQIHEGMQIVIQRHPSWRAPNWSVKVLSALPNDDFYDSASLASGGDEMEGIEMSSPLSNMDRGVLRCF